MFKFLKKEKEPENLKEVLSQFKKLKEKLKKNSKELKDLKKNSQLSIQKIGIIRFNPFKESGGNQSFSIALLDSHKNGIVITSLYGREGNRIFAKPIKNGKSEYLLTEEEKMAIEQTKEKTDNKLAGEKKDGKEKTK